MALGNVNFIRKDGNLTNTALGNDHISGLLFDVPADTQMPSGIKLGDVNQIFSLRDAEKLGINEYSKDSESFYHGIPHFHISEFFRIKPNGSLYIMFADCSKNWDAHQTIQSIAQGEIRQIGVWTPRNLWKKGADSAPYALDLVADLNAQAEILASQHKPVSIILSANSSSVDSTNVDKTVKLTLLPTCIGDTSRVTVLLGQGRTEQVKAMQLAHPNNATIGCVGAMLGCIANASVCESVAWVDQFNVTGGAMSNIEFGFGDMTLINDDKDFTSTLPYEALSPTQLNELDEKGYVFPIKYVGKTNGTYFSSNRSCSAGDFNTIARNRTIDKSRRAIRVGLLPFLHSPVLIDAKSGKLSEVTIKKFSNVITNILSTMKDNGEISGYNVNINTTQNVLTTNKIVITYSIVPIGEAGTIEVKEGFALTI